MSERTRVLLSARVYDRQVGGNTRYVREVYKRIDRFGVDFSLARPLPPLASSKARSLAYAGLESVLWPTIPPRSASVLHFPADTGAIVRGRVPIVSTIHGLATLHVDGVRNAVADRLWRSRVRSLARVSDRIITVSQSSAEDIARHIPSAAERVVVIPHGIDHDRFNMRVTQPFEEVRARLNLPDRYFLYMGNLDPRKNVIELTRAASRVFAETGVPLVVSGAPAWDSHEIMRAVTDTKGVTYVGRLSDDDIVPLLQHAVAFCFPSSYEGFGFPVLEAMACGCPVICSDRGSLNEVAGGAARILRAIDSESIALAMIELASDEHERSQLRARGLENAQRFQWEASARRHAELLVEVAR